MKLNLPKALVVAILLAMSQADAVTVSSYNEIDISNATAGQTYGSCTVTAVNGNMVRVTGLYPGNAAVAGPYMVMELNKQAIEGLGSNDERRIVYVSTLNNDDSLSLQWGLSLYHGNIRGVWVNTVSGNNHSDNGNYGLANNYTQHTLSDIPDEPSIVTAQIGKDGVALWAGTDHSNTESTNSDLLFYNGGLRSSTAHVKYVEFDNRYINTVSTSLSETSYVEGGNCYIVSNAAGTWRKKYSSAATSITETSVGVNLVTTEKLTLTYQNAETLNTNGGDIVVGGVGQLCFNTWGQGAHHLTLGEEGGQSNPVIYIGSSTHADAATQGVLHFISNNGAGANITVNNNIVLIEDSSMGMGTDVVDSAPLRVVKIQGMVRQEDGEHALSIVKGDKLEFSGGMDIGGLQVNANTGITIKGTEATVGALSGAGSITVDGTTLNVNGLYSFAASGQLATTNEAVISFGENATISTTVLTSLSEVTVDTTHEGFQSGQDYSFRSVGDANIQLYNGKVMLVDEQGSRLGNATYNSTTGNLSMEGSIYTLLSAKTHGDISALATQEGHGFSQVQLHSVNAVFTLDSTDQVTENMVSITGSTGKVVLAWSGLVGEDNTYLETAMQNYQSAVTVNSGAGWVYTSGAGADAITSVEVKAGGHISFSENFTGDISISGAGLSGNADETTHSALRLSGSASITGDIAITGAGATVAMGNGETHSITGGISSSEEGGSKLTIAGGSGSTLNVTGAMSGIKEVENAGALHLAETVTASGTFTKSGTGTLQLDKGISGVSGITVTNTSGDVELKGTLTDDGSADKKIVLNIGNGQSGYHNDSLGGHDLCIVGNLSYAGELEIQSGTLAYGTAIGQSFGNLSVNKITIDNGAILRMQSNGSNSTGTSIQVNAGGNLYLHDSGGTNGSSQFKFKDLIVNGGTGQNDVAAKMEICWKGTMTFAKLTGEGKLDIAKHNDDNPNVNFDLIQDFNGTVNNGIYINGNKGKVTIAQVSQAQGMALNITGSKVYSSNFSKTGAGSLSINNLSASGTFMMDYQGSLTITTLSIANNTTLKYAGDRTGMNTYMLTNSNISGATNLTVDLTQVSESALNDFNLGVLVADKAKLTTVNTAALTYDHSLTDGADGYVHYTANTYTWDPAWNLTGSPTHMKSYAVSDLSLTAETLGDNPKPNYIAIGKSDSAYRSGTDSIIRITSGGDSNTIIAGGTIGGQTTGTLNSWLDIAGGTYQALVGGSYANNWGASGAAFGSENSSSHVQVSGNTTVLGIVGGNWKCGSNDDTKKADFTGDSYISVQEGVDVTGSIFGGNTVAHTKGTTFTGDSHIVIHAVLGTTQNVAFGGGTSGSQNAIVGGNAHLTNYCNQDILFTGDTDILVDLRDHEHAEAATGLNFVKNIVGGDLRGKTAHANTDNKVTGTGTLKHVGDTTVSVMTADNAIHFTGNIIGGDLDQANEAMKVTMVGDTSVTLNGGTYTNAGIIVGGSRSTVKTTMKLEGNTSITLTSGAFNSARIVGGLDLSSDTDSADNVAEMTGKATVNINGGTVGADALVIGGSYLRTNVGKLVVGSVEVNLATGATVNGDIIGGHYFGGDGSSAITTGTSVGASPTGTDAGIAINLDGASVGTIYGGSYVNRNNESSTVQQGDIALNLESGTINGDVYAAGFQNKSTKMETDSTTVTLKSAVTFGTGSHTISGGYAYGSDTHTSTVTGTRKLALSSTGTAYNLTGVSFQDFDEVEAAQDATLDSFTTDNGLSKTGTGKLTLTSMSVTGGISIAAGSLANGGYEIGIVSGAAEGTKATISHPTEGTAITALNDGLTISNASITYTGSGTTTISSVLVNTDVATDADAGVMTFNTSNVRNLTANSDVTVSTGLTVAGELKLVNGKTIDVSGTGASLTNAGFKYEGGSIGYTGETAKAFSGTASGYSLTGGTLTHKGTDAAESTINGLTIASNTNIVNDCNKGLLLQGGSTDSPIAYGNIVVKNGYIAVNAGSHMEATSLTLGLREDTDKHNEVKIWQGSLKIGGTTLSQTDWASYLMITHLTGKAEDAFSMGDSGYVLTGGNDGRSRVVTDATTISAVMSGIALTTNGTTQSVNGTQSLYSLTVTNGSATTLNGTTTVGGVVTVSGSKGEGEGKVYSSLTLNQSWNIATAGYLKLGFGNSVTVSGSNTLTHDGITYSNGAVIASTHETEGSDAIDLSQTYFTVTGGSVATSSTTGALTVNAALDNVAFTANRNTFLNGTQSLSSLTLAANVTVAAEGSTSIGSETTAGDGAKIKNTGASASAFSMGDSSLSITNGSVATSAASIDAALSNVALTTNGTTQSVNGTQSLASLTVANGSSTTLNGGTSVTGNIVVSGSKGEGDAKVYSSLTLNQSMSFGTSGTEAEKRTDNSRLQLGSGNSVTVSGSNKLTHDNVVYTSGAVITNGGDNQGTISLWSDDFTVTGGSVTISGGDRSIRAQFSGADVTYSGTNSLYLSNTQNINSLTLSGSAVRTLYVGDTTYSPNLVGNLTVGTMSGVEKVVVNSVGGNGGSLTVTGENDTVAQEVVLGNQSSLVVQGASYKVSSVTFGTDSTVKLKEDADNTNATITAGSGSNLKNVTLSSGAITGATSGAGADIKALGEMTSLTLAAAADISISNVTLYDSSINANGHSVTYSTTGGSRVMAVASTASTSGQQTRGVVPGPAKSGLDGNNSSTADSLTATTVQSGGTATGSLTVDVAYSLLDANRGGTLTWTILDDVDVTGLTLQLGDVLTTLVQNGKPVVTLEVNGTPQDFATVDFKNADYNLLAGCDGLQHATVILTVENIPEPTTGALSVLALAGLAARRRRR